MSMPPPGHPAHPGMSWAYGPGGPLGPSLYYVAPIPNPEQEAAERRRQAERQEQLRNAPSELMKFVQNAPVILRERLGAPSQLCPAECRGWPVAESELAHYWITESSAIVMFSPGPEESRLLQAFGVGHIWERYGLGRLGRTQRRRAASVGALLRARKKDDRPRRKGKGPGTEARLFVPRSSESSTMQNACFNMLQRFQRAVN
jgi:hypothetical protein